MFPALLVAGAMAVARRHWAHGLLIVLVLSAAPVAVAQAPSVTNVAFVQQPNGIGGTEVVITYDLNSPNGPSDITVSLSKDAGADECPFTVTAVTGDLAGVATGADNQIVWDIATDYPDEDIPNAQLRVTADDGAPGETQTIMLPGDVPLYMVWIEPGTFMMGRYPGEQDSDDWEDPQHSVTLSSGFWMGTYELTKAQWTAVMGTTPWSGRDYVLNDPDSPAVYVSWNTAQAFITALNGLTGKVFRLPSEAEWEYSCRAGTTTRFYWGDDPSYTAINDYAWYYDNAWDVNERYAHVVGRKLPNARGLYDMSGNICEWCEDDSHGSYDGAPVNGDAWVDSPRGSYRVLRGGCWHDSGLYCRSARRRNNYPSHTYYDLGFRLAR